MSCHHAVDWKDVVGVFAIFGSTFALWAAIVVRAHR